MSTNYHNFADEPEEFPLFFNFSLTEPTITKLKEHFTTNNKEFEKSIIFNMKTKENESNDLLRKSEKAVITDPESFKLINDCVMPELNKLAIKHNVIMSVVPDEIDLIKYNEGGYFKKHRDFVNFISEQMKSYSLIISLETTEAGGETKLYFSDDNHKIISESKTLGGCLVFRNEIFHEGCEITKGTKLILKINIRCFINYENRNYDNILIIKFPNDKRLFVLFDDMYKEHTKCIFTLHKHFQKTNEMVLENVTYEQFLPIYDYMNGSFNIDIERDGELLNYLGIDSCRIKFIETVNNKLKQKYVSKMNELHRFLDNTTNLLLVKSYDDYSLYKKILENDNHIVPIQFMLSWNKKWNKKCVLSQLSIYDSIPIGVEFGNHDEMLFLKETDIDKQITDLNIGEIRILMAERFLGNRKRFISEHIGLVQKSSINDEDEDEDEDKDDDDDYNEYTSYAQINTQMINTDNDRTYLKELMNLHCEKLASCYNIDYRDDTCKLLTNEDITICSTIKKDKLFKTLNLIQEKDIIDVILKEIDHEKKISIMDYVAGEYECNEADYYLHRVNIYHGFVNLQ